MKGSGPGTEGAHSCWPAGECHDLLGERQAAMKDYQAAIARDPIRRGPIRRASGSIRRITAIRQVSSGLGQSAGWCGTGTGQCLCVVILWESKCDSPEVGHALLLSTLWSRITAECKFLFELRNCGDGYASCAGQAACAADRGPGRLLGCASAWRRPMAGM